MILSFGVAQGFLAAGEQLRLSQCREKMLRKLSLSALFASLRLNEPIARNRRPRKNFAPPLRTSDFRLRRFDNVR